MLRAEEPLVLRHELEELRVLELQVVEARDVVDVESSCLRDQERISKIRARPPVAVRNRLVLAMTWTDERRRRTREQQVVRKKVLRSNRVSPV